MSVPESRGTTISNYVLDHLMHALSHGEFIVLMYILRRTHGFDKEFDRIAISQFTDGIQRRDDKTQLDHGTGLSARAVQRAIRGLTSRDLIHRFPPPKGTSLAAKFGLKIDLGGAASDTGGGATGGTPPPPLVAPTTLKYSKEDKRTKEDAREERAGFSNEKPEKADPYAEMHGDRWLDRVARDHRVSIGRLKQEPRGKFREMLHPDLPDAAERRRFAEECLIEARDKAMRSPIGWVLARLRAELGLGGTAPQGPRTPSAGGNGQRGAFRPRRETGDEARARAGAAFLAGED